MYSSLQLKEIELGRQAGVDFSIYACEEYDSLKMRSIRRGLEKNVDIKRFPLHDFNSRQIDEIVLGLQSGVEVGLFADSKFDADQMYQIRRGLEAGVDVSVYANPSFDHRQMAELRWSLKQGADISNYAKAYVSAERMAVERRAAAGESASVSGPVEAVKMWYGNPRVIERKFDVYVNNGKDFEQSKFLSWNSKVDQQTALKISDSLRSRGILMSISNNTTGFSLYNSVSKSVGGDYSAASVFFDAGIIGFSYSSEGWPRYVLFSKNQAPEGFELVTDKQQLHSEAERNAIIEKIREIHSYSEGNIDVVVVRDGMPLPKVVEQTIDDCCGVGYNGALYVNVDNIGSREEAVNLWIREVGAKEGLKALIPDDIVRTEFLGSVWDTAVRLSADADNREVCRIVADVRRRYGEREGCSLEDDLRRCPDYAKSRLGEMFFGEFANSVDVRKELTHQEKSFWKDISEKVKNIIGQAFGIKGEKVLNQKDLAKVCACAVKAGESQKSKIRLVLRDKINFRRKESERAGLEAAKKGLKI